MKTILKYLFLFTVISIQSCSDDDDSDCSARLCAEGSALLEFKIVDIETGENIAGSIISGPEIEVTNTSSGAEVNYDFITENDLNILRIRTANSSEYSIQYGEEEIFKLSIDAEMITEGCCSSTKINELSISGADFEIEEETGIYIIKKSIRPHLTSGESLDNYHAFFENSKLQIEPDENADSYNELLKIDVLGGEKLVFKLLQYQNPNEMVADDEVTKIVYFEIDPADTEFTLNPDNFDEAKAVIGSSASVSYIKYITEGEITGTKISDEEWQIAVNVSAGDEEEQFNTTVEESKTSFTKSIYEDVWMPIFQTHVFN
ncbi:hypothetical protein [Christiangramia sediminis]|uniref:Uncharacterized protein n=1 Tax=Christiangramia sediminis TaxID=2881336 RepID=A0A9X1LJX4_9FLAO|nr:hypothetical protein [Christiangramia sediminis]MCB7481709.1 hypothetical protein [Christiangramia sediminis]